MQVSTVHGIPKHMLSAPVCSLHQKTLHALVFLCATEITLLNIQLLQPAMRTVQPAVSPHPP